LKLYKQAGSGILKLILENAFLDPLSKAGALRFAAGLPILGNRVSRSLR
jgi:hypothetical protein